MMRSEILKFWFIVVFFFVLMMLGVVVFVNWDVFYGFFKDFVIWMSCVGFVLIFVIFYGVYEWRKGLIFLKSFVLLVFVWIIIILVGFIV